MNSLYNYNKMRIKERGEKGKGIHLARKCTRKIE